MVGGIILNFHRKINLHHLPLKKKYPEGQYKPDCVLSSMVVTLPLPRGKVPTKAEVLNISNCSCPIKGSPVCGDPPP